MAAIAYCTSTYHCTGKLALSHIAHIVCLPTPFYLSPYLCPKCVYVCVWGCLSLFVSQSLFNYVCMSPSAKLLCVCVCVCVSLCLLLLFNNCLSLYPLCLFLSFLFLFLCLYSYFYIILVNGPLALFIFLLSCFLFTV